MYKENKHMANKNLKRCFTSYVIREMQIKIMTYHCTPIRMGVLSRMLTILNASEDVEQQKFSFIAGGNTKWYSHFGR